jgi:hypothetical protein
MATLALRGLEGAESQLTIHPPIAGRERFRFVGCG